MSTEVLSRPDRLTELEDQIYRGFAYFYEAGQALQEIQGEKLYKEAGYKTFDDYCQARWGIKRGRAYQLIEASKVYQVLSTNVDKNTPLPVSEAQTRPLSRLPGDDQAPAWQETRDRFGDQPTGQQVEQVVRSYSKEEQLSRSQPKTSKVSTSGDFSAGPGIDIEFQFDERSKMTQEEWEEAGMEFDDGHRCPFCGRGYK